MLRKVLGLAATGLLAALAACESNTNCPELLAHMDAGAPPVPGSSSGGSFEADNKAGSTPAAPPSSGGSAAAARAVAEADIVQLDDEQDRIYAMSKNGTL